MDFQFTAEDQKLRDEVKNFVESEWDAQGIDSFSNSVYSYDVHHVEDDRRIHEYTKKLAEKGWYTMHWPEEFGGAGAPLSRQLAYREEAAYRGSPVTTPTFFAHTLMYYGQDWQKEEILGKIASGELINFSQGFSEPNAGADLGSLQTRAVQDGDDWVITGQKIWNTGGHMADIGHYLVRTDPQAPKHRGISYFIVDMHDPGITLRPLFDALGKQRWVEVFLDGARVPSRNLVGELNRGWYAAMTNMSFERSNVEAPSYRLRDLENFLDFARETRYSDGSTILDDPIARHVLADARVLIELGRMISYQVAWIQSKGEVPAMESAFSKLFHDEMTPNVFGALNRLLRESGIFNVGDPRAPMNGYPQVNSYLSWMNRFAGGGREIELNIIAQRGLGLPR